MNNSFRCKVASIVATTFLLATACLAAQPSTRLPAVPADRLAQAVPVQETLTQNGVVVPPHAATPKAPASDNTTTEQLLKITQQQEQDCAERPSPSPSGFDSLREYTCAYIEAGEESIALVDPAKLKKFAEDWNPSKWAGSDYLQTAGVSEKDRIARTFALIRRLRDALGNPEPFDYVFAPDAMSKQQAAQTHPQLLGGIGAVLELQNTWQIFQQLDKTLDKSLSPEQREKATEAAMLISPDHPLGIRGVMRDSPSWGVLKAGDIIQTVNGQSLNGLTIQGAVDVIRKGAVGSLVRLQVLRSNSQGHKVSLTLTLELSVVKERGLFFRDIAGIRYITILNFENPYLLSDFYQTVMEAQEQGIKGFILDVRGNPGGRLDYVKAMLEMLVEHGQILMTQQVADGTNPVIQTQFVMDGQTAITEQQPVGAADSNKHFAVQKREAISESYLAQAAQNPSFVDDHPLAAIIDSSVPIVVIANGDSYSAAEIFAGGLSGTHRATLVGQPTAGKNDIMTEMPLPECTLDAQGKCQIGGMDIISGWFFPGGKNTDLTGVMPDELVKPAADNGKTDAQLDAAIADIKKAAANLQSQKAAATASYKANSERFRQIIKLRNDNDALPVGQQDPHKQM